MSISLLGVDPFEIELINDDPTISNCNEYIRISIGLCIFAVLLCAFLFLILYKKID